MLAIISACLLLMNRIVWQVSVTVLKDGKKGKGSPYPATLIDNLLFDVNSGRLARFYSQALLLDKALQRVVVHLPRR